MENFTYNFFFTVSLTMKQNTNSYSVCVLSIPSIDCGIGKTNAIPTRSISLFPLIDIALHYIYYIGIYIYISIFICIALHYIASLYKRFTIFICITLYISCLQICWTVEQNGNRSLVSVFLDFKVNYRCFHYY